MNPSLRNLPSVERVLTSPPLRALSDRYGHGWLADVVRGCIDEARAAVLNGAPAPTPDVIAQAAVDRLELLDQGQPRPVINATGVIIHTNLGRAPLSGEAIDAINRAARGYSDLELDLATGRRGSRQSNIQTMLTQLTGAENALLVNNNAAALLLGLSALAEGGEVIVSRSEAVEIGGGFRVPDVLRRSGARLVEVGTTNRTYLSDYESAITDDTAAFLKVHASNFKVVGFTHSTEVAELSALGQRRGVPVLHDVGSGCLLDTRPFGLAHEPRPQDSVRDGADLVFFSGDKLLGGPQGGMVVGTQVLVERLSSHPLARAIRIDKMSLAATAATLLHYLKGEALEKVPVWRMISAPTEDIKARAARWADAVGGGAEVVPARSTIGGGSLPGETLPSWAVALPCEGLRGGAKGVALRLRRHSTPVVARIESERIIMDPRTVPPQDDDTAAAALRGALT